MPPVSAPALPDAEYLVLSSRLIPGLDGGYTIATLARARLLAAAGAGEGAGPQLLTFDPGTAAEHAEHRRVFTERGALTARDRLRNLFDEAVAPEGGAASWLRDAADAAVAADPDVEYRVLADPEGRPFAALPVIPGNPDWHLTDEPVLVYDGAGVVVGALHGFRGLYGAWLGHVTAAVGDRPIVVICESRQLGELIADWVDPRVRILHPIHTMHVEAPYTPDATLNTLWTRWFRLADRFDAVIWPTATQRDDVVARFGEAANHVVVPNPIAPVERRDDLREEGLVVVLGRLAAGKRIDHSIRAFIEADVPGSRMEIWGTGAEQERLAALIAELDAADRVRLCGYTADPATVLDRASVLVTSTAFEGQPLGIVEALLHGTPVVSYDVRYGIRDVLGAGGGVLVPSGDVKALGEALRELLTDQDRLAALRAEAPAVAAAWSPERSMEALATTIAAVVQAPSRRR
ncbi:MULTISPECIES: glycosyltransferase [unclassified Microbacterium]|uniref:glycosyltransferase n=1 Tax=unclassified Microbacterium TaxID=2609290 RepID=UPI00246882C8|nr:MULTISPECIES: glycosyltransferase [unclassified Microbacterium]MDH5133937.1 glycosyltransferase [Microbacterium sp. RD10]MDH5137456.1 glycosyltransferase [Microbacterium sp. RD11]MDH5145349.1 glycosyltransferase [Microbacterium sp. RD12]MDH5155604.1 glycosyltransferase [Microbacterium sp. RD06]MDH5166356.1 glycosyltransferase [Microbacterium sp. RD02]